MASPVRMRDVRLWLGLVLVAVGMLAGWRILATHDDTVTAWRATRDLSAGSALHDVEPVQVPRSLAVGLLSIAPDPADITRWPVPAGSLLSVAAVDDAATPLVATRAVSLAVDPRHLPVGLSAGDRVDVWSSDTEGARPPVLVLASAQVRDLAQDTGGLSGDAAVLLDVPRDRVGDVVAAAHSGALDLVAVPLQDQGARS